MRPFVAVLGNPRVERSEAPHAKPVLIVSNHVSVYDVPLILYALPGAMRRKVAVAMAGEMIMNFRKARNLGNWFLNLCGPPAYFLITALFNVFPLPQLANFRKSFAHAGHAMDRGYNVLVFPEGRRTPDGVMHAFQKGSGMLWKELQCDALPVYLGGMSTGKWFRSGTYRSSRQRNSLDPNWDSAQATQILEEAVRNLQGAITPCVSVGTSVERRRAFSHPEHKAVHPLTPDMPSRPCSGYSHAPSDETLRTAGASTSSPLSRRSANDRGQA